MGLTTLDLMLGFYNEEKALPEVELAAFYTTLWGNAQFSATLWRYFSRSSVMANTVFIRTCLVASTTFSRSCEL